ARGRRGASSSARRRRGRLGRLSFHALVNEVEIRRQREEKARIGAVERTPSLTIGADLRRLVVVPEAHRDLVDRIVIERREPPRRQAKGGWVAERGGCDASGWPRAARPVLGRVRQEIREHARTAEAGAGKISHARRKKQRERVRDVHARSQLIGGDAPP